MGHQPIFKEIESLLSKGMNFAPAPNKFDPPTIIAEAKSALNHQKIHQDTADNIRAKIVGVLNRPVHTHNNLSPLETKALKNCVNTKILLFYQLTKVVQLSS